MNEGTLDLELNGRPLDRVEATVDVPCCLHMCIRAVSCPTTRAAGVRRMGGGISRRQRLGLHTLALCTSNRAKTLADWHFADII